MFQHFLHTCLKKVSKLKTYFYIPLLIASFYLYPSHAIPFNTSYVSLEIPNNWTCLSEGVNWICFNKLNKRLAREAVIILTAKEIGTQDNLPEYLRHLKQKKVYKKKGKNIVSKVIHAKQRAIARHNWIDGFHLNSEIPSYYTRYIVSTKKNLGVLVTYSAHKSMWKKYAKDFNKSIASLRLLSVDEALRKLRERRRSGAGGGPSIQEYLEGIIGDGNIDAQANASGGGGLFGDNTGMVVGGGVGTLAGGLFLWRLLGRKKRKSSRHVSSSSRRRRRR